MKRCFKANQKLVRGTPNLLVERIYSIVIFKKDVSFVSLKEEIPNKSVAEVLESLPIKTFSSMLRMLLKKISFEKLGQ